MISFPQFLYNCFGSYDLMGCIAIFKLKYYDLFHNWTDKQCADFIYDTYLSLSRLVGDDLGTAT